MKVGCGFVENEIRGNRYLYFWSFQGHGARVKKIERYLGPASEPDARRRTHAEIEGYAARASAELAARVPTWRRELTSVCAPSDLAIISQYCDNKPMNLTGAGVGSRV